MPEYECHGEHRRGDYTITIGPATFWFVITGPDGMTVASESRLHPSHALALQEAEQKIRRIQRTGTPNA